jgi:hypothetical protein
MWDKVTRDWIKLNSEISRFLLIREQYSGNRIKGHEIGGTGDTCGKKINVDGFWWGNLKEWKHWNHHGVDGRCDNGY